LKDNTFFYYTDFPGNYFYNIPLGARILQLDIIAGF